MRTESDGTEVCEDRTSSMPFLIEQFAMLNYTVSSGKLSDQSKFWEEKNGHSLLRKPERRKTLHHRGASGRVPHQ